MSLELRLQAATSEYQKIEADLANSVEARQKLDAQLSENEQVKKVCCLYMTLPKFLLNINFQEFAQLQPSNTIYKLMGPVLVKQDQAEAKSNVETRLEYIRGEMYVLSYFLVETESNTSIPSKRVELQLQDLGVKSQKKKNDVKSYLATMSPIY